MKTTFSTAARLLWLTAIGLVLTALALPAGASQAKEEPPMKVTATAGAIGKDGKQTVTIKLHVSEGWHAYANPVQNEDLEAIRTIVQIGTAKTKKMDDVAIVYPEGRRHVDKNDSYRVYEGNVDIVATVKRSAGDTGALEVTVKFVTCNDKKGLCLPPDSVTLEVK